MSSRSLDFILVMAVLYLILFKKFSPAHYHFTAFYDYLDFHNLLSFTFMINLTEVLKGRGVGFTPIFICF
jgi:hypothetical protein